MSIRDRLAQAASLQAVIRDPAAAADALAYQASGATGGLSGDRLFLVQVTASVAALAAALARRDIPTVQLTIVSLCSLNARYTNRS